MSYTTEDIVAALRTARRAKGLSQRELSAKSGVPQGHNSKIENGAVDLRVSSLVALARILDLRIDACAPQVRLGGPVDCKGRSSPRIGGVRAPGL